MWCLCFLCVAEVYEGRLVFVLNSNRPVMWQIKADNISDKSKALFVVSEG